MRVVILSTQLANASTGVSRPIGTERLQEDVNKVIENKTATIEWKQSSAAGSNGTAFTVLTAIITIYNE